MLVKFMGTKDCEFISEFTKEMCKFIHEVCCEGQFTREICGD